MNHKPPTTNHKPPTTNHQPPTTNRQPPIANHKPPTTNRQPPTTNRHPPTTHRQPQTTNHPPPTANSQPTFQISSKPMDEAALRNEMCAMGRRLWERGLVGAGEGNLSARLDGQRVLSTPTGYCKGDLTPDVLSVLDLDGNPLAGEPPSSEIRLHLRAYVRRPDCMAVAHAHPPFATAFALAHEPIPDGMLPEAAVVLGKIKLVPFGMPGTEEVPDGLEPFLKDHKTFLLANHGAATLGSSLADACGRMEILERVAAVVFRARQLGRPVPLPEQAFEYFAGRFHNGKLD